MADETVIEVLDSSVHPHSGHISVTVRSRTTRGNSTWTGPTRTYGLDASMFQHQFNGDMEQVKAWIKGQHTGFDGAHSELVGAVENLKGKTL